MENKCSSPVLNSFSAWSPRPPFERSVRRMRLTVRVTPRSSADRIEGFGAGGDLRVRVTAAPADGQANDAVIKLLAKALGVPPRDVVLVAGAAARNKVFDVPLAQEAITQRLAPRL